MWLSAWYRGRWWTWLLVPVSWLFRGLARARKFYLQNLAPQRNKRPAPAVPIVVVGNITLGGTGKTPLLIALAQRLMAEGWRPGIISRGYGGRGGDYPLAVETSTSAAVAGDEPVLIARATGCPVVVGADRRAALKRLLADYPCDLVLSDDGLQHYQLPRDIEIVVVDGRRGLGNGHCLPAGPLREPPARLRSADWVVINGEIATPLVAAPVPMRLVPRHFCNLASGARRALNDLGDWRQVRAVAGIGHPERFFDTLRQLGLTVSEHRFADHHRYRTEDLQFPADQPLLMTSKDAVKCRELATVSDNWWYLEVAAELPERFYLAFDQQIRRHRSRLATDRTEVQRR
ncbi:tetraacyldisaccharide 4'-kinase [Exilibacterium tricleocarpae]|uniref:Tetraacyldisaccharide 4'-kinase n=1 Tax=Exilibacterium tricleocarpae TaxID=2591008 RepID=A0A545TVZ6_9GAMM|nr:tetraacyldisaccharide 4'-kinase [Exilibacterium tricleocarpae]